MSFSYQGHFVFLFGLSSPVKKKEKEKDKPHHFCLFYLPMHILGKHLRKVISIYLLGLCKIDEKIRDFT